MSKRLRIVQYLVQPVALVDDGDTLDPLPIEPIPVPAGRWAEFVETGLAEALADLQARIDQTPEPVIEPADEAVPPEPQEEEQP